MAFRALEPRERRLLEMLLGIDDPSYAFARGRPPGELVDRLDEFGSLRFADFVDGRIAPRRIAGSLGWLGVTRDVDGVPIQFAVFADERGK